MRSMDRFQARRRQLVALAGALAFMRPTVTRAANEPPVGWLNPRLPAPPLHITGSDGRKLALPAALAGKVTAVQLMFTGCSSSCPIQGALFAALAGRLQAKDVRLLSISIDALGDTPPLLTAWLARFGRHPSWDAGVADVSEVDRLGDFMKGVAGKPGVHTAQVFLFDRDGRLCHRTGDAPPVAEVEALLARVSSA